MLEKILRRVMREFAGWEWYEAVYLIVCTSAITAISVLLGDNALGIASAVAGTLYTLLAGKGKISCYFFGIFNSAAYGYICFENRIFGDTMLNWLWYLPMMFVGIACWNKKMNDRDCVIKNRLTGRGRMITLLSCAAAIAVYALFLYFIGGAQPIMDSSTTVLSVAAMILTVRRCIEQWLMWIAVNAISVGMWLRLYMTQGNSAATLLWWMIMLITGIIFFVRWMQEMRAEKTEQIN